MTITTESLVMQFLFTPVLGSALWIGGGSFGMLLIVVFVPPLLRRKPVNRRTEDATKPRN